MAAVVFLAGCAGIATDSPENPETTAKTESVADKPARESTASASSSGASSPATAAVSEPRSSWREGRGSDSRTATTETRSEAPRSSGSSGTASREMSGGDAALVTQLNEASRELATLRAANARLRAERDRPAAAPASARGSEAAAKVDPMDDKIAASLKSYAALKQELAGFLAEIERGRADNAAASAKLKEAVSRSDDARGVIAKLESELRAEKRARGEAEQAAAKLQEQLRTIGRALAAAGLNVDKLAAGEAARR